MYASNVTPSSITILQNSKVKEGDLRGGLKQFYYTTTGNIIMGWEGRKLCYEGVGGYWLGGGIKPPGILLSV